MFPREQLVVKIHGLVGIAVLGIGIGLIKQNVLGKVYVISVLRNSVQTFLEPGNGCIVILLANRRDSKPPVGLCLRARLVV